MDVNEKIVVEWLNLCKNQFVISNIPFKVFGPSGGSNYSNIDILSTDSKNNFYDYEIKWRSVFGIGSTDNKTIYALVNQLSRKERIEKIKEIIGEKSYKKILVTTKTFLGKSDKKRNMFISKFKDNGIGVIFFNDIIQELVSAVHKLGRYDSQVLQIIRMIKQMKIKLD